MDMMLKDKSQDVIIANNSDDSNKYKCHIPKIPSTSDNCNEGNKQMKIRNAIKLVKQKKL